MIVTFRPNLNILKKSEKEENFSNLTKKGGKTFLVQHPQYALAKNPAWKTCETWDPVRVNQMLIK